MPQSDAHAADSGQLFESRFYVIWGVNSVDQEQDVEGVCLGLELGLECDSSKRTISTVVLQSVNPSFSPDISYLLWCKNSQRFAFWSFRSGRRGSVATYCYAFYRYLAHSGKNLLDNAVGELNTLHCGGADASSWI